MTDQCFTLSTKMTVDLVLARFDSKQSAFSVMASFLGGCPNTEFTNASQRISNFTLQGEHLFKQEWREFSLRKCFKRPLNLKQALLADFSTARPPIAHPFYHVRQSMLYVIAEPKSCLSKLDFAHQISRLLRLIGLPILVAGKPKTANDRRNRPNRLNPASPFRRSQARKPPSKE